MRDINIFFLYCLFAAFSATTMADERIDLNKVEKIDKNQSTIETKSTAAGIKNAQPRPELRERPVKMIVGGQSEDGVAKEHVIPVEK